jgi:hypothetical protein
VNKHFTEAGIMVHAYLMYGFPTQTAQETIDSLEMVRQLFESGVLQSAFWHLFTMTAHSPVGLAPHKYAVRKVSVAVGSFANNDVEHEDPSGTDHESFGFGLKKSLLNYMHAHCFDYPLQKWFDFKVPKTTVVPDFIRKAIEEAEYASFQTNSKVIWLGAAPKTETFFKSKKGMQWEMMTMTFHTKKTVHTIQVDRSKGEWLQLLLHRLKPKGPRLMTLQEVKSDYEGAGFEDFELFWDNKPVNTLYKAGLLVV